MNAPRFLAWLRRGMARSMGAPDADPAGALPLRSTVRAVVDLTDSRGVSATSAVDLRLVGPADVVGLDAAQVVRMVPPSGATEVEANQFPFIELAAADLPWVLTPARATAARDRLRPWLVLVCVEERDGIVFDAGAQPLPVLRLGSTDAERELPDLGESWAWAHVQSMVPGRQIDAELAAGSGAVIARLVCPRQLLGGRRYRAALVPAFDAGCAAGLGLDTSELTQAGPAWVHGQIDADVVLPVYATWTFSVSAAAGDFEELARRLEPDVGGARIGYQRARLDGTELLERFTGPTRFEYAGPLVDPGSSPKPLPEPAQKWFEKSMRGVLAGAAGRIDVPRVAPANYDPTSDDPVIGPPLYGSSAVDCYSVPREGWLAALNLEPRNRAAAGLGAGVVRANQHEYLAAAWDQAGEVRALQELLNRKRLAAEVGRSHARRLRALGDEGVLQATARLQAFIAVDESTAAAKVVGSAILPTAVTSPAFARQTRRGSVLARRAGRARFESSVGLRSMAQFVAASVPADSRRAEQEPIARFGAPHVGRNTVTTRTSFMLQVLDPSPGGATEIVPIERLGPIVTTARDRVTGLAAAVRAALDPMRSIVSGLDRRITGIRLDRRGDLPTRIPIASRFTDPLFPKLRALGSDLVLPGVDRFGNNRARLLEVNEEWIAAFCAGANHEWMREALWNEYPADPGATSFSHFWPRVPRTPDLSHDMHEWLPLTTALSEHVGGAGSSTVMLVRGDVIRRYPDTQFMLVTPAADGSLVDADGNLPAERTTWPAFTGRLDAETVFVGFDIDPALVWSNDMYVGLEQPVTGPRFGLDTAATVGQGAFGRPPAAWKDLSWAHLARSAHSLAELTHIRFADAPWLNRAIGPLEWPRNSAHLAGITFQQPFRLLLPATSLMPQHEPHP